MPEPAQAPNPRSTAAYTTLFPTVNVAEGDRLAGGRDADRRRGPERQ